MDDCRLDFAVVLDLKLFYVVSDPGSPAGWDNVGFRSYLEYLIEEYEGQIRVCAMGLQRASLVLQLVSGLSSHTRYPI